MKPTTIPIVCGVALTAMIAAVTSHWWSVRQLVALASLTRPVAPALPGAPTRPSEITLPATPADPPPAVLADRSPDPADPHRKEFYLSLVREIRELKTQNRDLIDQLAETNRDIMKLEFRVDTHSEQFRPLPVSEDRGDLGFDFGSEFDGGVLPPRADPVDLPFFE